MKSHSSSICTVKKLTVTYSDAKSIFLVLQLLCTLEGCSGWQYYLGSLHRALCKHSLLDFACLVHEDKRYFPQGGAAALPGMPTWEAG